MPSPDTFARLEGSTLISDAPARLTFVVAGLLSSDDHEIVARFTATLRLPDDATDRRMFVEQILDGRALITRDELTARLLAAVRAAVEGTVRLAAAAALTQNGTAVIEAIAVAALRKASFAVGLETLGPFELTFDSPTLRQRQADDAMRTRAEANAAARVETLRRASVNLAALKESLGDHPEISTAAALSHFDLPDANAIWTASVIEATKALPPSTVYAVAGTWADGSGGLMSLSVGRSQSSDRAAPSPESTATILPPPPDADRLGPLRSVTPAQLNDEPVLLIGGRHGVGIFAPSRPNELTVILDPQANSSLGFSRAAVHDGRVFACHGEAGVVAWEIDGDHASPSWSIRPDNGLPPRSDGPPRPRHLTRVGTMIGFALHDTLVLIRSDNFLLIGEPIGSAIVGILTVETGGLVITEIGGIHSIAGGGKATELRREGRPTTAAAMIRSPLIDRLVLAESAGGCEYVDHAGRTVGRLNTSLVFNSLAAAGDIVVGLTDDRQRVALWRPWSETVETTIPLAAVARSRVAGIAVV